MTFGEAREKLVKMGKGRFCTVRIGATMPGDGETYMERSLYIDKMNESFCGKTWEEAFEKLEDALTDPNR